MTVLTFKRRSTSFNVEPSKSCSTRFNWGQTHANIFKSAREYAKCALGALFATFFWITFSFFDDMHWHTLFDWSPSFVHTYYRLFPDIWHTKSVLLQTFCRNHHNHAHIEQSKSVSITCSSATDRQTLGKGQLALSSRAKKQSLLGWFNIEL